MIQTLSVQDNLLWCNKRVNLYKPHELSGQASDINWLYLVLIRSDYTIKYPSMAMIFMQPSKKNANMSITTLTTVNKVTLIRSED